MPTVSALEFQRKFGRFQHEAQRSHRTEDAADVVIDAVERAEMDAEHKPLDDLLT